VSGKERILKTRVKRRGCPGCGYLLDQLLVELARFPMPCPRCDQYTADEFQIVEWEQAGGESDGLDNA